MDETTAHHSDEDLMALYQGGDVRAFETLFQRHSGRVLAFLRQKTSPEVARDLTQEVFLKIHRARHQYSAQYPFLPWLFTITRNALVDRERLNESKVARHSTEEVETGASFSEGPVDEGRREELARALSTLPAQQRRAIELRYMNEWTFERIAADMQTSPVNVRQLVSRGIKKIRTGWGGADE
jgi:RNA polymerase sigma factor (sigma-70 family)